ncbi:MAG: UvrD-helicase domain-containing protein [Armatimonadota bacterium]
MSNSLSFTQNQKAAIDCLDKSVSVSAGAGSGKTEVLIRRFCRIVEEGMASPEEILTVTFTEKAAKEMKERIVQRFTDLGKIDDRRAVESAYIGTIHGFCRRVLLENAFEAGVDPYFGILGEAEEQDICNKIFDSLLESRASDEACMYFVEDVGIDGVKGAILSLYGHIRSLGRLPSNNLVPPVDDPLPLLEKFSNRYIALISDVYPVTESFTQMLNVIISASDTVISNAQKLAASYNDADFNWELLAELKNYHKLYDLRKGGQEAKYHIRSTRDALMEFIEACLDGQSYRYSNLLMDLTADFDVRYSGAKRKLGALDYNDLLIRTKQLFTDGDRGPSETARIYRKKFKFITLDEFQDTNRLQKQVIDAISGTDNVFTVGDIKQSIYGFIHSDVDIFRSHHAGIRDRKGEALAFQENFRSRKGIIDFVNWFFGKLWETDNDFEFEELKCAGDFDGKTVPDVELLLVPKANDSGVSSAETGRQNEAKAIAQRILEITGRVDVDETFLRTKSSSAGSPFKLSDIVILFRATSDLHIYEHILSDYGIDTYTVSGRGFYGTSEIRDIISLLNIIDNPLNDISIAAALKSPFAGISEDALFWLCRDWSAQLPDNQKIPSLNNNPGKIWQSINRLDAIPHLRDDDRRILEQFGSMVHDLLDIRSQPRITDLLDLALERSGFGRRLLAMPGGRRRYANVRKLYEVAQDFQAANLFGLADFVSHLKEMEVLGEREMEAATESEYGDVVRLMTIHKAKGLQAPVVFLADMSRKANNPNGTLAFDKINGLAMKVRNPETCDYEIPGCYKRISELQKAREVAESKRLLYVAMTRAEEHLILAGYSDLGGCSKKTYDEIGNWVGWLEKTLELGPDSREGPVERDGVSMVMRRSINRMDKVIEAPEHKPTASGFSDEALKAMVPNVSPEAVKVAQDACNRCFSDSAKSASQSGRFSVSQILDYIECPSKYRMMHIIGIPEDGVEQNEASPTGNGLASADFGHLVHYLLDRLDFSGDIDPQIDRLLARIDDQSMVASVRPLLQSFAKCRWCDELRGAARIIKESPFELMLDGSILAGRMDVLYEGSDGWTVLDYKTGRAEDRERYELQVGIYAYAASKLVGAMPVNVALVLLSLGDSWTEATSDGSMADTAVHTVRSVISGIHSEKFDPAPGKGCGWCPASGRCPAYTPSA